MKALRIAFVMFLAAGLAGCGYLSNDPYYDGGFGTVSGRLIAEGQPLDGTLVFVMDDEFFTLTTEPNGEFKLSPVPAGRDRALVAMWGSNLGLQTLFDLPSKGDRRLGDIELEPLSLLVGKIDLPDPQLAEVAVKQTPFVARPDRSGNFSIMLPEGIWDLEVTATGYLPEAIQDVTTDSGETNVLTSTIQPQPDETWVCEDSFPLVERFYQGGRGTMDVLFIVDNSGSMVGEQLALGNSFGKFSEWLQAGEMDYRIAVISTGMESPGCPACDPPSIPIGCVNETGENGRFQDRVCRNDGNIDYPDYVCQADPTCRVVDGRNLECFFDGTSNQGIVFVGVNGCGYERGLASMQQALSDDLLNTYNGGFLRPGARLAVIVVSDEEDCGEVGDVSERISGTEGEICYFAAKGVGPDDENFHPQDQDEKPYHLTPVADYAEFLWGLKPIQGLVTFSAIVGVSDPANPENTSIEYVDDGIGGWDIQDACVTESCTGEYCFAMPGTRYIELAQMTGGTVESICQEDFSEPMERVVGSSTGFRRTFNLSRPPIAQNTIRVYVDGEPNIIDWQWYAEKQAVVFYDDSIPKPYSLIEIEYQSDCP